MIFYFESLATKSISSRRTSWFRFSALNNFRALHGEGNRGGGGGGEEEARGGE